MQLLLKHGVDVNARDMSDRTPLHLASSKGDADNVCVIKHGADASARKGNHETHLYLTSSSGSCATIA